MFRSQKIAFFLALKSITRGNKGILALTILIMALAFINLICIPSIFLGVINAVNNEMVEGLTSNIVIEPEEDEDYIKQVKSIQSKINAIPGVVGSSAHYVLGATLSYDENKDGKGIRTVSRPIKSIDPEDEKQVIAKVYQGIVAGEYLDKSDHNKIMLGKEISGGYGCSFEDESLGGVKVGDKINVIFSNGIQREYEVKGIFSTKNLGVDEVAFITEKSMESVLGVHNRASEIIVRIEQTGQEDKYIKEFRKIGLVKEDIKPWTEYTGFIGSVTKSLNMINLILGAIGSLVAAVAIFIVTYINVVNKRRQIGILKAIGMKEQIIVSSYTLQALFYAVLGIGLGLILIYFFIAPYFIKNPLDFPIGWVSLVISKNNLVISSTSLIVAAIIGGFIPSWRGARESIIKAIWGA